MNIYVILAQIVGVFVIIFNYLSTVQKTKKRIVLYNGLTNLMWAIQYLLLGAITGCISCLVAIVRNLIFYFYKGKVPFYVLFIYWVVAIGLTIPFYTGFISILPMINIIIFGYALWQDDVLTTKYLTSFVGLLACIYDFKNLAFTSVLTDAIDMFAGVREFIRNRVNNKKKKEDKKVSIKTIWTHLKGTYSYAKSGKKYLYLFFFVNVLGCAVSIAVPLLAAQQIVKLTSSVWDELVIVSIALFLLSMFRYVNNYLGNYAYNKFYYDVRRNIQLDLTRETLRITQNELNNNSSGVFIERINNDTDAITDIFVEMIDYFSEIISTGGVLISTIFINKYIFISYVIFIILSTLVNKKTSDINYKNRREYKKSKEKVSGFVSEIVRGSKDIKILDAEDSFLSKSNDLMKESNSIGYRVLRKRSLLRMYTNMLRETFYFIMTIMIVYMLVKGQIVVASALIIYNYQGKIINLSRWIEEILEIIVQFDLAAGRIFDVLEGNEFEKESFGTKKLNKFDGNIEFKKVSFGYDDDNHVLRNMSFKINANETVAFVGPSGAGKSTVFNLISALNKPDSGSILFDGVDISELDKHSIRGNLSVISQNPYIYNLSIKENLKIIKKDATLKDIKEACRLACLDEFIETLPDKYDTIVGEGGVTLSGGQKQRLAIARALLLKTEIILFDEATSALDNETQSNIQNAINNMKGEYTILIIAHRLSTVINSDKIFVVDNGRVMDVGTHKELLKTSRTYKRLYTTELDGDN